VPHESSIDVSEIDVIFISNSASILALPFFTDNPDFNGNVYATEPTVNIGRFFMEELVEFVQNVPKPKSSSSKDSEGENVYKMLESALNFPVKIAGRTFNRNLREIYSKKSISDALLKIRIVGFNENIVCL
jgi:integrator complex subunit 9